MVINVNGGQLEGLGCASPLKYWNIKGVMW